MQYRIEDAASKIFNYDDKLLKSLYSIYRDKLNDVLLHLTTPGHHISIRVNVIKASVENVLYELEKLGLKPIQHTIFEEAILLPILGPYDIEGEGKVVIADKRAAESVCQGANLYGPGVLEVDDNINVGDRVVVKSPNRLIVGKGIARMDSKRMRMKCGGIAVEIVKSIYMAPKIRELKAYSEGLIYEQSIPSIAVSREVDPQPGEVIVDMCAAPGGKATHLVELSRGAAKIIAFDHSRSRIKRMLREVERLGLKDRLHIVNADSRYVHLDYPNIMADKIVLDPPCSSLGVRPKLYDSKTYNDIVSLYNYQFQFLKAASLVLRKGGILVYSTCTITLEENEMVILKATSQLPFELESLKYYPIGSKPRGFNGLQGSAVRFEPHIQDYPGYFIAKLRKV